MNQYLKLCLYSINSDCAVHPLHKVSAMWRFSQGVLGFKIGIHVPTRSVILSQYLRGIMLAALFFEVEQYPSVFFIDIMQSSVKLLVTVTKTNGCVAHFNLN